MAKYYDNIDWETNKLIDTCSIAFTTSEDKTSENTTAWRSMSIGTESINPNNSYWMVVRRPYTGKAGSLVTSIYNATIYDTNTINDTTMESVFNASTTITATTGDNRKALVLTNLYAGRAKKIKVGATFAATTTAHASIVKYQLYRM